MADPNSPLFRFQTWRAALPPALRLLLTINLATYLLYVVMSIFGVADWLRLFALPLTPEAMLVRPWTLLTYGVANLYPTFFGLIVFAFGALWLNWLGRDYEETYGSHRLFGLYVVGALGGAALAAILGGFAADSLSRFGPAGVWFGIWAPLLAVLCGIATLQPNRGIGLFLLGVVPLKWIAIVFVVLELAFSKDPTHLGAAATGVLFGFAQKQGLDLAAWAQPLFRNATPGYSAYGGSYGAASDGPSMGARVRQLLAREEPEERPSRPAPPRRRGEARASRAGATGQDEVDRILDKILEDGFESLTDEEKRILDEASRRS
ncbi:MAG: rhomboid family intramembrane serine protease [Rubricoccaceae bacterium]|nr:rhomboid family intramembrane serine protease [Rubricoccaceae bacterium]